MRPANAFFATPGMALWQVQLKDDGRRAGRLGGRAVLGEKRPGCVRHQPAAAIGQVNQRRFGLAGHVAMTAQQDIDIGDGMACRIEVDRHHLMWANPVAHGDQPALARVEEPINADQTFIAGADQRDAVIAQIDAPYPHRIIGDV